jgi:hypothetical protein
MSDIGIESIRLEVHSPREGLERKLSRSDVQG